MDTLEQLLFNLSTIAGIVRGDKIGTGKDFITVYHDSILQPITRWYAGENREKAARIVCGEVRTAITISTAIMESRYLVNTGEPSLRDARINRLRKIKIGLSGASHGIDNMCATYCDDANMIAHLKPLTNEISSNISEINTLLIALGEYAEVRDVGYTQRES